MIPLTFYMSRPDNGLKKFLQSIGLVATPFIGEAQFLVFGGGADINPLLYGEQQRRGTNVDIVADRQDCWTYHNAVEGQTMIGVCRGAQFLNVMSGGRLYQDVTGHAIAGCHGIRRCNGDGTLQTAVYNVTSTHHQMCIPGPNTEVLAVGWQADNKSTYNSATPCDADRVPDDVEAFIVENSFTTVLGVQWHPEYDPMGESGTLFCELLDDMLLTKEQAKKREQSEKDIFLGRNLRAF